MRNWMLGVGGGTVHLISGQTGASSGQWLQREGGGAGGECALMMSQEDDTATATRSSTAINANSRRG